MAQNIILNECQQREVDGAVNHILKGRTDPYEIAGGPGTGKSVVLNKIREYLGFGTQQIAPMAFIGQAAIVMRLKGFENAKTFHSWLYTPEMRTKIDKTTKEVVMDTYLGIPDQELTFIPKDDSLRYKKVAFVDEGYMVPMTLRMELEKYCIPTVVTGDPNQLPPIGDKPGYLFDTSRMHFLTQVMRQNENSGIVYLANRALAGLPINPGWYGDALVIYEDQLTNDMIASSDIVLCGTNKTRDSINHTVRSQILGYHSDVPQYYEKVICRSNDWKTEIDGIGLANGLIGRVMSPPEPSMFSNDRKIFYMDFMPDLFNGVFNRIDVDYDYFVAPCGEKQRIKMRRFQQGHCFDFAYCITTHLAQGGEYPRVLYIEEELNSDIQNKINFVAITRAKEGLIYVKKRYRKYYNFTNQR